MCDYIQLLLDEHCQRRYDHGYRLWALLNPPHFRLYCYRIVKQKRGASRFLQNGPKSALPASVSARSHRRIALMLKFQLFNPCEEESNKLYKII